MRNLCLILFLVCSQVCNAQLEEYAQMVDSAFTFSGKGDMEGAERCYRKALSLMPENKGNCLIWGNIGSILEGKGDKKGALEAYTMALNIDPKLVPVLLSRAALYDDILEPGRAMLDYTSVLDVEPNNVSALLGRGFLRMQQRMLAEAKLDFEAVLMLEPMHMQASLGEAIVAQKQGRFKQSAELFQRVIEAYPGVVALYEARANMEREAGWTELAHVDLEEAYRISKDPNYLVMQAVVYFENRQKRMGRTMLKRAEKAGVSTASLKEVYQKYK